MANIKTNNLVNLTCRFTYAHPFLRQGTEPDGSIRIYTTQLIKKGEIICIWGGQVVHKNDIRNLSGVVFSHTIREDFCLISPMHDDGIDSIYYIRQSETPNAGFDGEITLVAMRDINPLEEITLHYSMMNKETVLNKLPGSEVLRKKFNHFFPYYIQKEIDTQTNLKVIPEFDDRAWGLLTSVDIDNCNPDTIRSKECIQKYVIDLCELIEMKRFGECHVVYFGEEDRVAGYSMFQLIETSCISGHFANESNTSYIDIFSCKSYDPKLVAEFTKKTFGGNNYRISVVNRF